MHQLIVENPGRINKAIPKIEKKIKIKIIVSGDKANLKGSELNEFLAVKIIRAVDFGFDVEDAFLLLNEDFNLKFIDIKEHTRRKKLEEVRGRVIGREGRAKGTIEELISGKIVVHGNRVGIIVDSEHLDAAVQAIQNLIQGAKHANIFAYLERRNRDLKMFGDDLGLKEKK